MNSLDICSVGALMMRALKQIHSTMDLEVLPERVFSAITALVPGAVSTIDELDLESGVVTGCYRVDKRGASLPGRYQEEGPRTHAYASCDAGIQSGG
jgi:hypothetical protein